MRVGVDVSPITRDRTGIGNYCFYLLKNLVALHPETTFLGLSSGSAVVDLGELAGRIETRHIGVPTRVLYQSWEWLRAPKADRLLGGMEVYHGTNFFLPPTSRARRVLTVHDLTFLVHPEYCDPRVVGPFARRLRRFAREADGLLVYSQSTKRDVVKYLEVAPERIVVAPLAVDEQFNPMLREAAQAHLAQSHGLKGPFILYAGTMEARKNTANLVRAFGLLAREIPHKLVVVGGRGYRAEETLDAIKRAGLEERVVLMGYLPEHTQLRAFYCGADVFVFPTRYEGFGLPVLEAMACGCPVVTCENSSLPELAGRAAVYVEPESPAEIAAGIRRVIERGGGDRDLMAVRGLERALKFSWKACAEATHGLYERLAGS